ncbi:MAG: phosphoribosyltransferase [Bacteroidota bacterium]
MKDVSSALKQFVFPETKLVIGIGSGGIVPASLVAHQLGCDMKIIHVNYRKPDNNPAYESPKLLVQFDIPLTQLPTQDKILIVDDVAVSGKTIDFVKKKTGLNKAKVFVMKGKADYVLFPDIKTCVDWPWK